MTQIFKLLNPKAIIAGFALGIIVVSLYTPSPTIVYKFPTPYNQNTVYIDKNDSCYKYQAKKVPCDEKAQRQPLVEDFSSVE